MEKTRFYMIIKIFDLEKIRWSWCKEGIEITYFAEDEICKVKTHENVELNSLEMFTVLHN